MPHLKLVALDWEDLIVISASMQDAVLKVGDLDYDGEHHQFLLAANRFAWEKQSRKKDKLHERRRCNVVFKCVKNVKFRGIHHNQNTDILSLLAIQFYKKGDGPEGEIELVMSDNVGILLDVECIEVQLSDTGGAWETKFKPHHKT